MDFNDVVGKAFEQFFQSNLGLVTITAKIVACAGDLQYLVQFPGSEKLFMLQIEEKENGVGLKLNGAER